MDASTVVAKQYGDFGADAPTSEVQTGFVLPVSQIVIKRVVTDLADDGGQQKTFLAGGSCLSLHKIRKFSQSALKDIARGAMERIDQGLAAGRIPFQ